MKKHKGRIILYGGVVLFFILICMLAYAYLRSISKTKDAESKSLIGDENGKGIYGKPIPLGTVDVREDFSKQTGIPIAKDSEKAQLSTTTKQPDNNPTIKDGKSSKDGADK